MFGALRLIGEYPHESNIFEIDKMAIYDLTDLTVDCSSVLLDLETILEERRTRQNGLDMVTSIETKISYLNVRLVSFYQTLRR